MRITQGAFSFLPDLSDEEILAQVSYSLESGWAVSVEFTDDPHPRNTYWSMWGLPMFDLSDPAGVMYEINRCRQAYPNHYVRVNAFDSSYGRQTTALSFIVNRPAEEPGFRLSRTETQDRRISYSISSYASNKPSGERY